MTLLPRTSPRALLLSLLLLPACYTYRPATAPQPGAEVRVRLNTEAAVRRSAGLDDPIIFYSGRLLDATPQSISLDVLIARDPSQFRDTEIRETVTLQRSELESLTVRELSTPRTILFTGAMAVGGVVIVKGIKSIVGGSEDDNGDGGPQAAVQSLFRLDQGGIGIRLQLPFRW
ncbi:MAG TPA: hypothetical protein VMN60_03980 [Longimicrobiales bacterium]|nr:hypothetical protein [Longimicrobiales bacterium]